MTFKRTGFYVSTGECDMFVNHSPLLKITILLPTFLICRFTGCVATAGAISGTRTVTLQWMAYQTVANDVGFKTVKAIPLWTSGTKCVLVDYPKVSGAFC